MKKKKKKRKLPKIRDKGAILERGEETKEVREQKGEKKAPCKDMHQNII
jgi:hypothetical protein